MERTERRLKAAEDDAWQDYLEALGKTEEQYREELKPTAEVRLKRGLALNEIIKQEESDRSATKRWSSKSIGWRPPMGRNPRSAQGAVTDRQSRDAIKIDLLTQAGMKRLIGDLQG